MGVKVLNHVIDFFEPYDLAEKRRKRAGFVFGWWDVR